MRPARMALLLVLPTLLAAGASDALAQEAALPGPSLGGATTEVATESDGSAGPGAHGQPANASAAPEGTLPAVPGPLEDPVAAASLLVAQAQQKVRLDGERLVAVNGAMLPTPDGPDPEALPEEASSPEPPAKEETVPVVEEPPSRHEAGEWVAVTLPAEPAPEPRGGEGPAPGDAVPARLARLPQGAGGLLPVAAAGAALTALVLLLLRAVAWAHSGLTRLTPEKALAHPARQAIHGHLAKAPGCNQAALQAMLGLNRSTVEHHLAQMERCGLLVRVRSGRSTHCFLRRGAPGSAAMARLLALRNPGTAAVASAVAQAPGVAQRELARSLGVSTSTVIWHTARLEAAGVVVSRRVGRHRRFYCADGWTAPAVTLPHPTTMPGRAAAPASP